MLVGFTEYTIGAIVLSDPFASSIQDILLFLGVPGRQGVRPWWVGGAYGRLVRPLASSAHMSVPAVWYSATAIIP